MFIILLLGAGKGNRTLTSSLEGLRSTIELHPHNPKNNTPVSSKISLNGGGGKIRTFEDRSQRVYSPPHLTALEPLLWGSVPCSIKLQTTRVLYILFM